MSEHDNIRIVRECYEAFRRGDLPGIMERVSDDLTSFGVVSDAASRAPWHLEVRAKKDVPKFFEALLGSLDTTKFEPSHFAAAGDRVYVTLQQEYRVKKTGKTLRMRDVVHRFDLKGGRVVAFAASEDTALTLEALRG